MRMMRTAGTPYAVHGENSKRHAELSGREIPYLRRLIHKLVHDQRGEIEEHQIDDSPRSARGRTGAHADESRFRDRQIDHPPLGRQEDMATELKRLRRENEILRQERDILKRATAFFAREGSR